MATTNRGLPQMAGADLASTIDDTYDAAMAILDNALVVIKDVFSNRPDPVVAKQGAVFQPTDLPGYLYLSDGTNWIEVAPGMGSAPIGASMEYWGSTDPGDTRWVKMDGRALSTTTFAALYALIGNTYDTMGGQAAPGAGLFRIPLMAGRVSVGAGAASGLTTRVLGASGGEETHQTTVAEMPSHVHLWNTNSDLGFGLAPHNVAAGGDFTVLGTSGISGGTNMNPAGGGAAHNNMQPFVVCNRIMRVA